MSEIIIVPSDGHVERLRKQLKETIKDPRERKFEELRGEGFDSETAADLAGLSTMTSEAQMRIRLENSTYPVLTPVSEAVRQTSYEIPMALRSIGSTTGAAVGSAVGASLLATAAKHGTFIGTVLGVALVTGVTVALSRFVARTSGFGWAAVAVVNVVSIVSIVGRSYLKGRR